MPPLLENRTFDEIDIGDSASVSHVLTQQDIQLFALMSGDVNPAHLDEEYARSDQFHQVVGHGMWGASLISTVLGTQLPGPGTIYLSQNLQFRAPVMIGDQVQATVTVKEKQPEKHRLLLDCHCTNQQGKVVISGEALVIAPTEKIRRAVVQLPKIRLIDEATGKAREHDYICSRLLALKDGLAPLKTAVVHPVDANSLGGAIEAAEDGIIIPLLVGPEAKIRAVAKENGWDISSYELIPTEHSHAAAARAVELVHQGRAEALMKGKIHTDELMHPIVDKVTGLRTDRRMSHIFVLDVPTYHKPLFLTDAALNIAPSLMEKRDIVQNAIDLFITLGLGVPKVAVVSAVETVEVSIPSTLDAAALCKMAGRGQIVGGIVDGPLAFDNAISAEAARVKGIASPVAGDADIIVVPDIESGNMLYKQMQYFSGVDSAGVVVGARVPIILTSRAAGPGLTRKASSVLALLYARRRNQLQKATV